MALSMEEQRILAEIEQEFARSEPVLAARLATFGRAGRAVLRRSAQAERRSARILVMASLTAVVLLTVLPVVIYTLVALRGTAKERPAERAAVPAHHHAVPPHPTMSAPR
jgi:hypothetical protein